MAEIEVAEEEKRSAVARHPDRDAIIHLLRVGRSAYWISRWLEDGYAVEDEDEGGDESPDRHLRLVDDFDDEGEESAGEEGEPTAQNAHLQLSEKVIEEYRERFMPETTPGVDVLNEDLEEFIGYKFPGALHWELEVVEAGVHVSQVNVARALKQDEEMNMLQQTTLDANDRMMKAAETLVGVKQKLGLPGYEAQPDHIITENTNRNWSVELHGRVDKSGRVHPAEPERLALAAELLKAGPQAKAIMAAAQAAAATETVDAEVVDEPVDG